MCRRELKFTVLQNFEGSAGTEIIGKSFENRGLRKLTVGIVGSCAFFTRYIMQAEDHCFLPAFLWAPLLLFF